MPTRLRIFEVSGTVDQINLVADALGRGDFPWERLVPGIQAQVGRDYIPLSLSDLSRFAARAVGGGHGTQDHQHDHGEGEPHVLETRNRVLGLFWTNYKIELEVTLEREPELLAEVLWAEGAHAIDQALLDDQQRAEVERAFHGGVEDEHTWWERSDYGAEYNHLIGEAFMAGIIQAYTDIAPTLQLHHVATEDVGQLVRAIVTPDLVAPPTPEPVPTRFFGKADKKTFHDSHKRIPRDVTFASYQEAVAAGRRPCRSCRPKESR